MIGTIPTEIASVGSLHILYLNRNQLTGVIPSEITLLNYILFLALSDNEISGPIPTQIADPDTYRLLIVLALYSNDLTGAIPGALDVPTIEGVIDCSEIRCVQGLDKDGNACP